MLGRILICFLLQGVTAQDWDELDSEAAPMPSLLESSSQHSHLAIHLVLILALGLVGIL